MTNGRGSPSELNRMDERVRAAILQSDWDTVLQHSRQDPAALLTCVELPGCTGFGRRLPLHWACARHAPSDAVITLLELCPESLQARDEDGMLPIHCACFSGAASLTLAALATCWADGLNERWCGQLPIHLACAKHADADVVRRFVSLCPESLMDRHVLHIRYVNAWASFNI